MADTVITIPNEEQQTQAPVADSQLQMAIQFGEMKQSFQNLVQDIANQKINTDRALNQIEELRIQINSLHSQQAITSHQAATLNESLTDIQSELTEDSESRESSEVTEIIPPMETKIEIEQKPANNRSMIQKFLFGK